MLYSKNELKLKSVLIFLLLSFFIGGCASTGSIKSNIPVPSQANLSGYKTLKVSVSSDVPECSREIKELEMQTLLKIREINHFKEILNNPSISDSDLELKANIVKIRKISQGSRLLLGALAGQSGIIVNAELIDKSNQKKLCEFSVEGKSSGGTVFAGTTSQAIERAAEQIALYIKDNI